MQIHNSNSRCRYSSRSRSSNYCSNQTSSYVAKNLACFHAVDLFSMVAVVEKL